MGKKLPVITGKDLLQFYIKMGCELKRIKGSHHVIKSIYNDNMFVIPVHRNEELDGPSPNKCTQCAMQAIVGLLVKVQLL